MRSHSKDKRLQPLRGHCLSLVSQVAKFMAPWQHKCLYSRRICLPQIDMRFVAGEVGRVDKDEWLDEITTEVPDETQKEEEGREKGRHIAVHDPVVSRL